MIGSTSLRREILVYTSSGPPLIHRWGSCRSLHASSCRCCGIVNWTDVPETLDRESVLGEWRTTSDWSVPRDSMGVDRMLLTCQDAGLGCYHRFTTECPQNPNGKQATGRTPLRPRLWSSRTRLQGEKRCMISRRLATQSSPGTNIGDILSSLITQQCVIGGDRLADCLSAIVYSTISIQHSS